MHSQERARDIGRLGFGIAITRVGAERKKTVEQSPCVLGVARGRYHLAQFVNQPVLGNDFASGALREHEEIAKKAVFAQPLAEREAAFRFGQR